MEQTITLTSWQWIGGYDWSGLATTTIETAVL